MREEFRPVTIDELEGKKRRVSRAASADGAAPQRICLPYWPALKPRRPSSLPTTASPLWYCPHTRPRPRSPTLPPQDIEEALVKQDIQRAKIQERQNAPGAMARAIRMNEAQQARQRGKMMLPAPQVSDAELEALARAGEPGGMDVDVAGGWVRLCLDGGPGGGRGVQQFA